MNTIISILDAKVSTTLLVLLGLAYGIYMLTGIKSITHDVAFKSNCENSANALMHAAQAGTSIDVDRAADNMDRSCHPLRNSTR